MLSLDLCRQIAINRVSNSIHHYAADSFIPTPYCSIVANHSWGSFGWNMEASYYIMPLFRPSFTIVLTNQRYFLMVIIHNSANCSSSKEWFEMRELFWNDGQPPPTTPILGGIFFFSAFYQHYNWLDVSRCVWILTAYHKPRFNSGLKNTFIMRDLHFRWSSSLMNRICGKWYIVPVQLHYTNNFLGFSFLLHQLLLYIGRYWY